MDFEDRQIRERVLTGPELSTWRGVEEVLNHIDIGNRFGYAYEGYDVQHLPIPAGGDGNYPGIKSITLRFRQVEAT